MKFFRISRNKGTITIFVSLILAAVMFFNSVLIDSAKVLTAQANLNYKLTLAAKSLLAAFDRTLFEYYGIIATSEKENSTADIDYYFNSYSNDLHFTNEKYLQILPFQGEMKGVYTEYTDSLADINILQCQITDIMKFQSPANLLESVLEGLDILNSGEDTGEGEGLYREACEYLDILSEKADELYRTVEGWSENDITCVNGFNRNLSREITINKIKSDAFLLQGLRFMDIVSEENQELLKALTGNCLKLKADYETYAELNRKAQLLIKEIQQLRQGIIPRVTKLKSWVQSNIAETEAEMAYMEKLKERIVELEAIINKTEYKGVNKALEKNITILNSLLQNITELYDYFSLKDNSVFSYEYVCKCLDTTSFKEIDTSISVYTGSGSVDPYLAELDPRKNGEVSETDIIKNIESIVELDEDIFESLPSVRTDSAEIELENSSIMNNVLTDDYILTYFTNSATENSVRTSYFLAETEYILNGNSSEKKNVENTYLKIFGFRTGLNLIHVLCDSDKRQLAISIGNAIAGATYGIGGPLYAALIAAAWATAEAALDIEALKKGEEVPLLKTSENWKLSIEGLSNTVEDEIKEEEKFSFKMDYSGYLRLLLFMTPQKTKLLRIQDLIELNLTKSTGNRFYLGNYFTGLNVECDYYVPTVIRGINFTEEVNVSY